MLSILIVFAVKFSCLEFAFQLLPFTSDIISFQFVFLRTSKHAKLLKDKRFELENLTSAVGDYTSQVNDQKVEISLFCT